METRRRNIWITVAACVGFAALMIGGLVHKQLKPRLLNEQEMLRLGAMVLQQPRRFSDFELVDHRGERYDREKLTGKWTLLFPGFTFCPDVCPTTLATLNRLYVSLDEKERRNLQIVLLSIDPERDTAEKLAPYVTYFNPDFIGLTGHPAQILSLATQLSIVYSRVPLEGDDYTMDHSSNIVIINPRGDYHGFFRPPLDENAMRQVWRSIASDFKG